MREHRVLESGLSIYTVRSDSPVSHFQLFTPFGGDILSYRDPGSGAVVDLEPGSAHYFEHVLFIMPPLGRDGKPIRYRTNTPKTRKNLRDGITELENNKAIVVNAYTANDHTNYWYVTRQNSLSNLEIMLDFVLTPYLPQERFRQEQGTIADEIARGDNESYWKLAEVWGQQALVRHGGRSPIAGTKESIARISLEDVLSMHDTFYRPSNMTLVATGNVSMDAVAATVESKLRQLGKSAYSPPPGEVSQAEPAGVLVKDNFGSPFVRPDVSRPNVLAGWKYILEPGTMPSQELMERHVAAEIAALALFTSGSRIRERLVQQGMDERTFSGGNWDVRDRGTIMARGDTDDPELFRKLILSAAEDALTYGIPAEEIEYARCLILTGEDMKSASLIDLGGSLAGWGALTRNPFDYFAAVERFASISPAEVNALLPELLAPENLSFALMAPGGK